MQDQSPYDIIAIGGSAGSLPVLTDLLGEWPATLDCPVVIVIHRLKNVHSELHRLLSVQREIIEPEDKDPVSRAGIYLTPQNYHLLIERDHTFSLDNSEPVNFSRPSIDLSFASIADVYGPRALGILLSGANNDGASGLCRIIAAGGTGIAQEPATAAFDNMPRAAIAGCNGVKAMTPRDIIHYLNLLTNPEKR